MGSIIGNMERSEDTADRPDEAGENRCEGRQGRRRASLGELFMAMGEAFDELGMGRLRVEMAKGFAEGEVTGRRLLVEVEGCSNCSDMPDALGRSCAFGEIMQGILEGFNGGGLNFREIKHRSAGERSCLFEASKS